MHLNCLQENLRQGLGIVQRAVATRTTLPITQHVLIATDAGRVKLSATNLEIAISTWIGAQVEAEGSITIPARLLTEFVGSLEPQTVSVKTTEAGTGIEIKGDRTNATMHGSNASEFPPIPTPTEGAVTQISPKALRDAIHQVVFAAAFEDSRPVLTGVNMHFEGDRVTFAAADGFRLAVHHATLLNHVEEEMSAIVPARTMAEVERLIDGDAPIDLVINPQRSQVLFRLKDIEVVSQLIQGTFPNYGQLVPTTHDTRAVVDLAELRRVARTASIFAKDGSGIIRLRMEPGENTPGHLTISSRAEEVGDSEGQLEAQVEGAEGRIAFNARYLTDVLGVLDKDKVALEMTSPSSPGVIRQVDDEAYVHVVMPMFVQW